VIASQPLPNGFRIVLDPGTRVLNGGRLLIGGQPRRILRLSDTGAAAFAELRSGPVKTVAAGKLARRLVSTGAAHPRPPRDSFAGRVVVIVPVLDRVAELDRCLHSLGRVHDVLVVDDGSSDGDAVAKVVARHGARLARRPQTGGPAAARNTGLEAAGPADIVAFLDSDCVAPTAWLDRLLPHFADPAVAAVAPRVMPAPVSPSSTLARYAALRSPLDLGPREALVQPGTRVSYVPTASLLVRTAAAAGSWFEESLRYGEDVDLIWRLVDADWQVRYDPTVVVHHAEPETWPAFLGRHFRYGTSAGPLSRRHPTRLTPIVLHPWPSAITGLLLARRPTTAGLVAVAATIQSARRMHKAGVPPSAALSMTSEAVTATALGVGRVVTQLALPVAIIGSTAFRANRARRLAMLATLVITPALRDWLVLRPSLDPIRWSLASIADDVAYGAGVWRGAVSAGTATPLLPRTIRRLDRLHRPSAGRTDLPSQPR
jgi:mycofactocin system glycosyltransferase